MLEWKEEKMREFRVKFIERIKRAEAIESFRFSPENKVEFAPGQFLKVFFDELNKDNKDLNKYLSFSCAPEKEYIEVTKRRSESNFSQRLWSLKKDDEALMSGPMGTCTFDSLHEKVSFIVGGIGITPAISIIEHVLENNISSDMRLLYSNMKEEDIAFKKELEDWNNQHHNFQIVWTVAEGEPKDKKFFKGLIDKNFILEHLSDCKERLIFIFGPPKMVVVMKNICLEIGCDEKKIKAENFVGY